MKDQAAVFTEQEKRFIELCKKESLKQIKDCDFKSLSAESLVEGLSYVIGLQRDDSIIDFLIDKVDPELISTLNQQGLTMLQVAIRSLSVNAVRKLLDKSASPNDSGSNSTPPPMFFLTNCYKSCSNHIEEENVVYRVEIAKMLLAKGANPNLIPDDPEGKGATPFISMCCNADYEMVTLLLDLKEPKVEINKIDIFGRGGLAYLVYNQNIVLVERMLNLGANPNQISNSEFNGKITPLDLAIAGKNQKLTDLLKSRGACTALELEEVSIKQEKQTLKFSDKFNARGRIGDLDQQQRNGIFDILHKPSSETSESFFDELKRFLVEIVIEKSISSQLATSFSFLAQLFCDDEDLSLKYDLFNQVALLNCELHDKAEIKLVGEGEVEFDSAEFCRKVIPVLIYDLLEIGKQMLIESFNDESKKFDTSNLDEELEIIQKIIQLQTRFKEAVREVTGKNLEDLPIKNGPVPPPNSVIRDGKVVVLGAQSAEKASQR